MCFALIELAIGAGLIGASSLRATRVVCAASIAWGLGVWLVGEGAGGLLTLHAALSTGAPGAALIYCVLTVAAWPVEPVYYPDPHCIVDGRLADRCFSVAAAWSIRSEGPVEPG